MREGSILDLRAKPRTKCTSRLQSLRAKLIRRRSVLVWLSYPNRFLDEGRLRDEGGGRTSNPCRIAALQADLTLFYFLHSS